MAIEELQAGDIIDNERLVDIFGCSPQGGMRRSKETNTLVIVSNHVKSLYQDRWDGTGILHYTGMGTKGNQRLDFAQNATLSSSATNGVDVHLFEVFRPRQYTYRGRVQLAGAPYTETQPDEFGNQRIVWMFPLLLVDGSNPKPIPKSDLGETEAIRERTARKLSDEELRRRAEAARASPGRQQVVSTAYTRDESVAEMARRRATGMCQLCEQPAPFQDKSGRPFLEVHHIVWLARGGQDTLQNTVALCPNCHRRMHILDNASDKRKLLEAARGSS